MKFKKLTILTLVIFLLLSGISSVSAGWFDFGNDDQQEENTGNTSSNGKTITNLTAGMGAMDSNDNTYAINIHLTAGMTNGSMGEGLNETVDVNVTDPNGVVKNYNQQADNGFLIIWVSEKGTYNINAVYEGNEKYEASTLNTTVEVKDL